MSNINNNIILITGQSNSGKTTGLEFWSDHETKVVINTDAKTLPFKHKYKEIKLTDPRVVIDAIAQIEADATVTGAALDTLTFLMRAYENQYVVTSADTQRAWGQYAQFYIAYINAIKAGTKDYVVMAHEADVFNEKTMEYETTIPVKGAVGKTGVNADFSVIVRAVRVNMDDLEGIENDYLHITEEEKEDGVKYVFQTRITETSKNHPMRSPRGLWERNELYIDNNVQTIFDKLHKFYN
jgi:hypothetical protein